MRHKPKAESIKPANEFRRPILLGYPYYIRVFADGFDENWRPAGKLTGLIYRVYTGGRPGPARASQKKFYAFADIIMPERQNPDNLVDGLADPSHNPSPISGIGVNEEAPKEAFLIAKEWTMAETQERQVETVTMEDGRSVDFAGKKQILKHYGVLESGRVYGRFDFRNGKTVQIVLPTDLEKQASGHGLVQKGGDATAGAKDLDDAVEAVLSVKENIEKGDWNARVEGTGFAGISVLAKALVEVTGKSPEQVKEFLKSKTPADKIALRNSGRLRPVVERLEAEKATKSSKVDAEALLAELA